MRKRLPTATTPLYGQRKARFTDEIYSFEELSEALRAKKKITSLPRPYLTSSIIDELSERAALECLFSDHNNPFINLTLYSRPGEKMISTDYSRYTNHLLTALASLVDDQVIVEVVFPPSPSLDIDQLPPGRWQIASANLDGSSGEEAHLADIISSSNLAFDDRLPFAYYRSSAQLLGTSGGRAALRLFNRHHYLNARIPLREIREKRLDIG